MAQNGVECVDCLSVDNALVRLGDPLFAGYCHELGAECGAHPYFYSLNPVCYVSLSRTTCTAICCI